MVQVYLKRDLPIYIVHAVTMCHIEDSPDAVIAKLWDVDLHALALNKLANFVVQGRPIQPQFRPLGLDPAVVIPRPA
jgi:hypothetical protein